MLNIIAGPGAEPVSLPDAKLAARVDDDALDAHIASLIIAAREQAEHITGRRFGAQTLRAELADWPSDGAAFDVPRATAVATSYWTGSAWTTPEPLSEACWGAAGNATAIAAPPAGWPVLGDRAAGPRVRIDISCGEAADEAVRLYIKGQVAHWLDSPAAAQQGALERNPLFDRLLDRARVY